MGDLRVFEGAEPRYFIGGLCRGEDFRAGGSASIPHWPARKHSNAIGTEHAGAGGPESTSARLSILKSSTMDHRTLAGRVEDWRGVPKVEPSLFAPRFLWECLISRTVNPFPAPATSHPACRFPALGAPVCLVSRVMGPIVPGDFRT